MLRDHIMVLDCSVAVFSRRLRYDCYVAPATVRVTLCTLTDTPAGAQACRRGRNSRRGSRAREPVEFRRHAARIQRPVTHGAAPPCAQASCAQAANLATRGFRPDLFAVGFVAGSPTPGRATNCFVLFVKNLLRVGCIAGLFQSSIGRRMRAEPGRASRVDYNVGLIIRLTIRGCRGQFRKQTALLLFGLVDFLLLLLLLLLVLADAHIFAENAATTVTREGGRESEWAHGLDAGESQIHACLAHCPRQRWFLSPSLLLFTCPRTLPSASQGCQDTHAGQPICVACVLPLEHSYKRAGRRVAITSQLFMPLMQQQMHGQSFELGAGGF